MKSSPRPSVRPSALGASIIYREEAGRKGAGGRKGRGAELYGVFGWWRRSRDIARSSSRARIIPTDRPTATVTYNGRCVRSTQGTHVLKLLGCMLMHGTYRQYKYVCMNLIATSVPRRRPVAGLNVGTFFPSHLRSVTECRE